MTFILSSEVKNVYSLSGVTKPVSKQNELRGHLPDRAVMKTRALIPCDIPLSLASCGNWGI